MNRMKSLFAAVAIAASVAVVPVANAQVLHFSGAGSSAMFQGFGIAAYNDLALGADGGGICVGGLIKVVSPGGPAGEAVGDSCLNHHWSVKTAGALASAKDGRSAAIPAEFGNFWTVYVTDTTIGGAATDVWSYLSIDSTVGVRTFLAVPRAKLILAAAAQATAGANVISSAFFVDGSVDSASVPADVWTVLSGAAGQPLTAGMTDIRPEDAKLATERILGKVPAPFGGGTSPTTANPFIYSFSLGYGPGPVGLQIKSAEPGSTAAAQPVEFSLPGGTDPFSLSAVSSTIQVLPVGESPIIFVTNRSDAAQGLGQLWATDTTACSAAPGEGPVGCTSVAYTHDGGPYVRNVWDQHPFPGLGAAVPNVPNLNPQAAPSYCSATGAGTAAKSGVCHGPRRPIGSLLAGFDCEVDSSAFEWPLDPATQGLRTV